MAARKCLRYSLTVILIVILLEPVTAQRWKLRRYEAGFGVGMTQVFGDIGGTADESNWFGLKDIRFDETRMAFPLSLRYRIDPFYTLKVNAIVGFANGNDADSRNDRGRSYKAMISELSAQAEYYFIAEERRFKSAAMFNRRGMLNNYMSISAYGFLGIGGVYSYAYNLNAGDQVAAVDDYRTHNLGVVLPFGLGVKYILDDRWILNAELGYRYSFSDYIEGYKQTAASKHNDVYYFLNLTAGYRLETTRRGIPGFLDKEFRQAKPKKNALNRPKSKKEALK